MKRDSCSSLCGSWVGLDLAAFVDVGAVLCVVCVFVVRVVVGDVFYVACVAAVVLDWQMWAVAVSVACLQNAAELLVGE